MKIVNITNKVDDVFNIPCCSICDNSIDEWEEVVIGVAFGVKCLVHKCCAEGD